MEASKADLLHRIIAKAIDIALALLVSQYGIPGIMMGTLYLFIGDFIFEGQSVGKKTMKIKVLKSSLSGTLSKLQLRDSILRNFIFGALLFLNCLPLIKYLGYVITPFVMAIELYFVYFDPKGIRLGDIYAETIVVSEDVSVDAS